jgi:hypothetical protein
VTDLARRRDRERDARDNRATGKRTVSHGRTMREMIRAKRVRSRRRRISTRATVLPASAVTGGCMERSRPAVEPRRRPPRVFPPRCGSLAHRANCAVSAN